MKVREYSVKDHKFAFSEPFQAPDDAVARRYFGMIVNGSGSNVMNYAPADFDLFAIAEFDTESGQVTPIYPVEFIVNGASVAAEK